jgi:hypothetical protein
VLEAVAPVSLSGDGSGGRLAAGAGGAFGARQLLARLLVPASAAPACQRLLLRLLQHWMLRLQFRMRQGARLRCGLELLRLI